MKFNTSFVSTMNQMLPEVLVAELGLHLSPLRSQGKEEEFKGLALSQEEQHGCSLEVPESHCVEQRGKVRDSSRTMLAMLASLRRGI